MKLIPPVCGPIALGAVVGGVSRGRAITSIVLLLALNQIMPLLPPLSIQHAAGKLQLQLAGVQRPIAGHSAARTNLRA